MRDPFVIHRNGTVSDRASGEYLGEVYFEGGSWIGDPLIGFSRQVTDSRRDAAALLWEASRHA